MGPKGCPTPPTFDTINLTAYSGHWYQIGITARFQFVSEPGLVCGRVGYTLTGHKSPTSHPALLSVVNSGLTILRPAGVADIRNVPQVREEWPTGPATPLCARAVAVKRWRGSRCRRPNPASYRAGC